MASFLLSPSMSSGRKESTVRRLRFASVVFAVAAIAAATLTVPASATGGAEGVPALNHVFLVIGENTQLSQINAGNAPYLTQTLMPASASLTNYWATTH